MSGLSKEKKEEIKQKIIEAIQQCELSLRQLESATEPISPENSIGRLSRMDAINNKGVSDAAMRQKERQLIKLKKALEKIDSPSFGICKECGIMINPKRIMYMPESDTCVHCADR